MDPHRLDEADWNFCHANAAFMGCSAIGHTRETQHVHVADSGAPGADFNSAWLKLPVCDLPAAVATAEACFDAHQRPFHFAVRSDHEAACAPGLEAAGYVRWRAVPAMLLDPISRAPGPARKGLEVRAVDGPDALEAFRRTAFAGFGLPPGAARLFLTEQLAARPDVTFLLGRIGGEPACTSALVSSGPVAGIYWVATLAEHRGRGLGAAITWAAVEAGLERGCRFASLQASQMGAPVYARMGFATPVHYVRYARPQVVEAERSLQEKETS
jgi:GNAT superfamily N-acetyltransferase